MKRKTERSTYVLLSFNGAYRDKAWQLASKLQEANINVIFDEWQGGGGLPSYQHKEIDLSGVACLIPLLSPSNATELWVDEKWRQTVYNPAIQQNIKVLAARVEHCSIPKFLSSKSFSDFAGRNYEHELYRLVSAIKNHTKNHKIKLPANLENMVLSTEPVMTPQYPILLEFSPDIAPLFLSQEAEGAFNESMALMFDGLFFELGVQYPNPFYGVNEDVPSSSVWIWINDYCEMELELRVDKVLVNEVAAELEKMAIAAEPFIRPETGASWAWISVDKADLVQKKGFTTWDFKDCLILNLSALFRNKAAEFMSVTQTQILLKKIDQAFPILIQETVPKNFSVFLLTDVLRRLVSEQICIRNMRLILMELASWGRFEHDPQILTEYIRIGLKRQITHKFNKGTNNLVVILLDPEIENMIINGMQNLATGVYLDLPPEVLNGFLDIIKETLQKLDKNAQAPQILTISQVRACVRRLIAPSFPNIHVISYPELIANVSIQPLARISLAGITKRQGVTMEGGGSVWRNDE